MKRSLSCVCLLVCTASLRSADLPDGWFQNWEAAVSQASEGDKPMFVVFSATWCGPCQSMVKNIYPQDPVREKLKEWIPVYIDVDKYEEIATRYRANQLPTLVYLNADLTEINRTIGAVSTVEQMIELLETQGGAKFAGGATSLAAQGEIIRLTKQIAADSDNLELLKQRFALILDQAVHQVSLDNLNIAYHDYRNILQRDSGSTDSMREDYAFLRTLMMSESRPQFREQYLTQFETQYPQSQRLGAIWVDSAKRSMRKAKYTATAAVMKKYIARFPDGEYIDEFKLLLPQIEGFLELSKGVSFD